jgi:hypothetical protein
MWILLVALILSGCITEHYYTDAGDECFSRIFILYQDTDCKRGDRPIQIQTDEKKDIKIENKK